MKNKISIIIKINNFCNLKCKHCYESCNGFFSQNNQIMPLETLERIFSLCQSQYKKVSYIWFGGEPLINGLDWFKKAILLQKQHFVIKKDIFITIKKSIVLKLKVMQLLEISILI